MPKERFLEVFWNEDIKEKYQVTIEISAFDLQGLLAEITMKLNENKVPILGIHATTNKDCTVNITMTITVQNKEFLNSLIFQLKNINGILYIKRAH